MNTTPHRLVRDDGTMDPGLLTAMLAADGDAVVFSDASGRVRWASPSVSEVFGWSEQDFLLVGPHLSHPEDDAAFAAALTLAHGHPGHHHLGEFRHLAADGDWRKFEVTAINLLDDHAVVVTRFRDLTIRERRAKPPVHLDEVTGLPRRTAVQGALTERLERTAQPVAVLFLDLDGFKAVNDRFGHCAGDAVLREVTERLHSRLRESEMLARWGGDEFVVLVDVPGMALATTVAARLHSAITDAPYEVDGHRIRLGVSIGVALSTDLAADAERLVRAADHAMYEAKRAGGGIVTAHAA